MSNYTSQLNLRFDPFDTTLSTTDFFAGGRRKNILDELLHLANYSSQIAVVTGPLGSGKSTLGRFFAKGLNDDFAVVVIQASLFMDQVQLLENIGTGLGINISLHASPEKLTEAIIAYASFLADKSRTIQLVIDDAHELGGDSLQLVLDLVSRQVDAAILGEGGIKLALFGESQLMSVLALLPRIDLLHIELDPFDEDDAIAYLKFKLSASGYTGKLPFDLAVVSEIWDRSNGVPGALSTLAGDELEQHEFGRYLTPKFKFPKLHLVVATSLFAALLLGWFITLNEYNETETNDQLVESSGIQRIQLPSASSLSASASISQQNQQEVQNVELEVDVPIISSDVPSPESATESGVATEVATRGTLVLEPTETNSPVLEPSETDSAVVELTDTDTPVVEPTAREMPEVELAESVDAANVGGEVDSEDLNLIVEQDIEEISAPVGLETQHPILARPSDSLTIQLLGSYSESNVRDFIASNGGGDNFSYFETRFKDKPWFVVVYGNYSDRNQARTAISELPESLSDLKPWIRELSDIQSDIRKQLP